MSEYDWTARPLTREALLDAITEIERQRTEPVPSSIRLAWDVWAELANRLSRRGVFGDGAWMAGGTYCGIPVEIDRGLAPGDWYVRMSDGTERRHGRAGETGGEDG